MAAPHHLAAHSRLQCLLHLAPMIMAQTYDIMLPLDNTLQKKTEQIKITGIENIITTKDRTVLLTVPSLLKS